MNDYGAKFADDSIESLEDKLAKEYEKAYREVKQKADTYFESFSANDKKQKERLKLGEITQADYDKWRTTQMLVGSRFNALTASLATSLVAVENNCAGIINSEMLSVFAENYNFGAYIVESGVKVNLSFGLYNPNVVNRLVTQQPNLLPLLDPDDEKSYRWNVQHVASALTQGVLQGDSVPHLARRLRQVTEMDYRASIRNARTAITSAQNAGRLESFNQAVEKGVIMKKQWLSTLDDRTRHSHALLDGEKVDLDEPFITVGGNKLMYPADPNGEPEDVYNCRCTMLASIEKFEIDDKSRIMDENLGNMTYEEWKQMHYEAWEKEQEKKKG